MTISSTVSRLAYNGNGSTVAFSVSFKFIDPEDLKVYVGDALQVLDTDYTVTGGSGSTGTVTFSTAPASTDSVVILRDPAILQETDYVANDPFPAETHERALDKLTMIAQRHSDLLGRSMTLADSDTSSASLMLPSPEARKVIGWNQDGTELENLDATTLASIVAFGTAVADKFSGTGAQTAFTLSNNPGALNNLDVSIGGVTQSPGDDYTWTAGTTLTFTSAPPSGTNNILVRYMQALPQGYADASGTVVADAGNYFSSNNAESVLQEVGASISDLDYGQSLVSFNVMNYATPADQVSQTLTPGTVDLTYAIQAALDAAAVFVQSIISTKVDVVTAKVKLPAGLFKTTAVLTVGEGVTLEGEGQSVSVIKPTHTGVAIQMGGNSREYSRTKVKSLGIIGNRSGSLSYGAWTTTTTIGIYAENCIRECSIEDCFVSQCATSVQTENSYAFEISKNYLVYALDYHIVSDNAVNGWICGNRLDWSEGHGIYFNGTNSSDETIGVLIEANAIQICWKNAVWLYDCSAASIINNFFESNYREAVDASTHVYSDVNIEAGPNSRGYSFNVIGNFFTHGSAPDVDAYTAIRCNRAVSLVCIGNACRDSWYYRFIDASNTNVSRIIALGNSFSGTFSKIVYDSSVTVGLLEEAVNTGEITLPQAGVGSLRTGTVVSSSNQTSSALATSYLLNCSGGNRQLFLLDADCVAGRIYVAKKTDAGANQIIVTREGGSTKTVDGAVSVNSTAAYGVIRVISDGTNWFTI